MKQWKHNIIIGGGGTGGHVFPAIAIADAFRQKYPDAEILFVGANNRLEMEKVPAAGYKIIGLPIEGFPRKLSLKFITCFIKLFYSIFKSFQIVMSFKPSAVIGVGGYASGPILFAAQILGYPTLIQEQNSYAGVTNRLLAKRVRTICVAYPEMEAYFPKKKIVLTGNPVRKNIVTSTAERKTSCEYFGVAPDSLNVLILGGSLGAATINRSVVKNSNSIAASNVQFICQTGKRYFSEVDKTVKEKNIPNIKVRDFITEMEYAYKAADVIISRAGACTISELCIVGKPVILVPSPNVAEDHQTKNALALAKRDAALYIKDSEAEAQLINEALTLASNEGMKAMLSKNIRLLAIENSSERIVDEITKLNS